MSGIESVAEALSMSVSDLTALIVILVVLAIGIASFCIWSLRRKDRHVEQGLHDYERFKR